MPDKLISTCLKGKKKIWKCQDQDQDQDQFVADASANLMMFDKLY